MNCCYLLFIPGTNRTYIGATKDPAHRLRQHNGELTGGAKATKGQHWTQAFYLSGFPDWRSTLQFEWAWKYHGRGKPGLKGKITALKQLLKTSQATRQATPFCEWTAPIKANLTPFQQGLVIKIDDAGFLLANPHSLLPAISHTTQASLPPSQMSTSKTSAPTNAALANQVAELVAKVGILEKQFADLLKSNAAATPAKGGKRGAKKEKVAKDPDAPKRAPSNFMNFSSAKRAEVKAANPDAKVTEISKILGAQWALLTQAQKDSYKAKA
jgi:predicted GIY-YIG superfamily endonuclease